MNKQAFEQALMTKQYEEIYNSTTETFREHIAYEQLTDVFNALQQPCTYFGSSLFLDGVQHIWLDATKQLAVAATLNAAAQIDMLVVKSFVQFDDTCYTQNVYEMPIADEWYVFWGGTNEFINYHYPYETQRYAYDLVMAKNGQTYAEEPTTNAQFYAFGQAVTAPCDGLVVDVVTDVEDNALGVMNSEQPAGNYVVLKHKHGEYSLLAHFRQHTIAVAVGDEVRVGQYLGECGNSGNSSEPHIHFHVMNGANAEHAQSLRIRFAAGEPVQGDYVRPTILAAI